jgi:RHS repeat-associated protein
VEHIESKVTQVADYYPFGMQIKQTSTDVTNPLANKYLYNGKELQTELGLDWYDYGARMYDAALGRWHVPDANTENYYSWSPYNYAVNNPMNVIDPDGNDIYILIWYSEDGETGHAGVAIDNYKTVEKKDENGNTILDKDGNPVTEQVKDGTMTYYDLWPYDQVNPAYELQTNVKADYSKGVVINSLDDLKNTDPTTNREGNVSPEGRAADGIVQVPTTYDQDEAARAKAQKEVDKNRQYNACYNNCSTYTQRVLNAGISPNVNAGQDVRPKGALRLIYDDANVVAPNNLYNAALKVKGAKNIKGPASATAKPYLEYFGKSNRTQ